MAAKNDNLVLIQCIDTRTNTEVPVICTYVGKDDEMEMVPLAVQFTTNPYAFIEPPSISESEIH